MCVSKQMLPLEINKLIKFYEGCKSLSSCQE